MSQIDSISGFFEILQRSLDEGTFIKMTLGKSLKKDSGLKNVYFRIVEIKGRDLLSFVYRYQTKDITKNFNFGEAIDQLKEMIGIEFLHVSLFTQTNDVQLLINKKRVPKLLLSKPTQSLLQDLTHDRQKARLISIEGNIYLQKLGVTNSKSEVIPSMQDKFRQISKYIELVENLLGNENSDEPFRVSDMGSGKGYLTFSLYDHLANNRKMKVELTGIELREELVINCNRIAREAGFDHLHFLKSSINEFDATGTNLLIALHACNTATDDAIFAGIKAEAKYIVVAPCCHKQVRKAMQPPDNLKPMLRHGIFAERQAELITDAIRALILEKYGYQTRVFEFIDTEHTPKNVMIVGVKKAKIVNKTMISEQIHEIKKLYGIEFHYLEDLLTGYEQIVK
ncbi:MAG: SAM-dependent methyltransferase [Bacteroidales bacterium]|nr:SAM-dependent methyltransferase [Bacteroidales bacterium]